MRSLSATAILTNGSNPRHARQSSAKMAERALNAAFSTTSTIRNLAPRYARPCRRRPRDPREGIDLQQAPFQAGEDQPGTLVLSTLPGHFADVLAASLNLQRQYAGRIANGCKRAMAPGDIVRCAIHKCVPVCHSSSLTDAGQSLRTGQVHGDLFRRTREGDIRKNTQVTRGLPESHRPQQRGGTSLATGAGRPCRCPFESSPAHLGVRRPAIDVAKIGR